MKNSKLRKCNRGSLFHVSIYATLIYIFHIRLRSTAARLRSRKKSKVFGLSWSRIFLSDSYSGNPPESFFS